MRRPFLALSGAVSLLVTAVAACHGATEEPPGSSASASSSGVGGAAGGSSLSLVASVGTGAADAGSDADNGAPSHVYPAPHPAPPQVAFSGGPVLAHPKVSPVFFAGEDPKIEAGLGDFLSMVGATKYWAAIGQEYGVGTLSAGSTIRLAEAAPPLLDDDDIQLWLAAKLNAGDPAFPVPDDDTLLVLSYPAGTKITATWGGVLETSCKNFGGYHGSITLDAQHGARFVAYVVVPRCGTFGAFDGIDAITAVTSHELIEAATDPYIFIGPAYADPADVDLAWALAYGGGEVGDMCQRVPGAFTKLDELPYAVQRTWSNAAALAGHQPCVPAPPGEVYFNSAPVLDGYVVSRVFGPSVGMKGVKVPAGESRTIDVDSFSDGDTSGGWLVSVQESVTSTGAPLFDYQLDRDTGDNGEKMHLTITANGVGQSSFVVSSSSFDGTITTLWVGFAGN